MIGPTWNTVSDMVESLNFFGRGSQKEGFGLTKLTPLLRACNMYNLRTYWHYSKKPSEFVISNTNYRVK